MKAVRIHAFGEPEVLTYEEAPTPKPGPGEVLLRVHGAGVNPVDWKTRKGAGVAGQLGALPAILGWELAGEVVAIGPGETAFVAGDRVYALSRFPAPAAAYAEFAVVPAAELARAPAAIDLVRAGAVPLAALTAWQALFEVAGLESGRTVLVHAAAGGVGHFAVQLAAWKGARVVATASAGNRAFVEALGADEVIDYGATPFETVARDVDVVIDAIGGEVRNRSWSTLRPGGLLVALNGALAADAVPAGRRGVRRLVQPNGPQLTTLASLIDQGHVRPVVEQVFPLTEAAAAHRLSEQGHVRGKIVLDAIGG
ncbi:NADP-dependent oxidoreductase [Pleomorphomonas carboxyditropha]|uniref:Enoyl reductase (ER) domain-containing protein n=1 Tax=Pleomorphomonas carboxyditropha TaxID=2023338 RepID=A0A2G9X0E6_9HYPH|nr:NADP-dependent oxidoreductase [Pleomorphomonas carboxyditropha]PIP00395.1 hypothetical protein CJ014_06590 [Pleomorphomonas carboxyditropha]